MTIEKVSFRDFSRGIIPADVLMLEDKKSKTSKGLYIRPEYADMVLKFLKQKEKERIEKKRKALLDFVGKFGDGDDLSLKSHQAIKAEKYE